MRDGQHDHLNQWPFLVNGKAEMLPAQVAYRSIDGSTLFELSLAGTAILRLAAHWAAPAIRHRKLGDDLARPASRIHPPREPGN